MTPDRKGPPSRMRKVLRMCQLLVLLGFISCLLISYRIVQVLIVPETEMLGDVSPLTSCEHHPDRLVIFTHEQMEHLEHGFTDSNNSLLHTYIRQRYLFGPSKAPRAFLKQPTGNWDYSWTRVAGYVDDMLGHRENGFFVDVGAYDGEQASKTLFFELRRNWTGLLIEPNSKYFTELLQRNRRCYAICACASPEPSTGKFYLMSDEQYSGLAGLPNTLQDRQYHTENELVTCFPLPAMLYTLNRTHVDYLVLDISGPEVPVLRNFPFHDITVDILSVGYQRRYNRSAINEVASRQHLNEVRRFFEDLGGYKEVGIAPVVDRYNRDKSEGQGYDVVFQRISTIKQR